MNFLSSRLFWWIAAIVIAIAGTFASGSVSSAAAVQVQVVRAAPRPPAQTGGTPAGESAAPDGYAPIPEWLGQTRAPKPAKTAPYAVETVVEGLAGAFSFNFLPDGRMIVAERAGRLRIVSKDGKISEVGGLPANLWARGQGLFE